MGFYVHIHVCFACDTNEGVAALANKHLPRITGTDDGVREARWFLESLSERTGNNPGPKGGLSLWGMVGNYTVPEAFINALRPFFTELLTGVEGGPHSFEHVLLFVEREQSERTTAYEISKPGEGELRVREHECPFAFMQF